MQRFVRSTIMDDVPHGREVRLWFALLGRGSVGAVIGMILMADPWAPTGRTIGLFVAYLLADCVLGAYAAKRAGPSRSRRGPLAVAAVVDGLAAVMAVAFPAAASLRLIGGLRGIVAGSCDARWSLRHKVSDLATLGGVAAAGLGVVLLAWPGPGSVALPWLLGLQAMVSGSLYVGGALSELRRVDTTVVPRAA